MQLPTELHKEIDAVVQYIVYNFRRESSVEMQLNGIDPTPYLDHAFGYQIVVNVVKSESGWAISDLGLIGLVDGNTDDTADLPDIESDGSGD